MRRTAAAIATVLTAGVAGEFPAAAAEPPGCDTPPTGGSRRCRAPATPPRWPGRPSASKASSPATSSAATSSAASSCRTRRRTPTRRPPKGCSPSPAPVKDVKVGDRVLVTGRATEFNGLDRAVPGHRRRRLRHRPGGGPANVPAAPPTGGTSNRREHAAHLPPAADRQRALQPGRFGEVTVSSGGRLFQPTDRPGVDPRGNERALRCSSTTAPPGRTRPPVHRPARRADRRHGQSAHRRARLRLRPLPPAAHQADQLPRDQPAPPQPFPVVRQRQGGHVQHAELVHHARLARRHRRRGAAAPARQAGGRAQGPRRRRRRAHGGREQRPTALDAWSTRSTPRSGAGYVRGAEPPASPAPTPSRSRHHLQAGQAHAGRRRPVVAGPGLQPSAARSRPSAGSGGRPAVHHGRQPLQVQGLRRAPAAPTPTRATGRAAATPAASSRPQALLGLRRRTCRTRWCSATSTPTARRTRSTRWRRAA